MTYLRCCDPTRGCLEAAGCYWHGPHTRHQTVGGDEDPRSPAEREAHRITARCANPNVWGVNEDGWW